MINKIPVLKVNVLNAFMSKVVNLAINKVTTDENTHTKILVIPCIDHYPLYANIWALRHASHLSLG